MNVSRIDTVKTHIRYDNCSVDTRQTRGGRAYVPSTYLPNLTTVAFVFAVYPLGNLIHSHEHDRYPA